MNNNCFSSEKDIKHFAFNLTKNLKTKGHEIKHSEILDCLSQTIGYKNWNTYSAILKEKNKPYVYINKYKDVRTLFDKGTAPEIIEMICAHNYIVKKDESSAMWQGRVISLTSGIISLMVWMRDNENYIINYHSLTENSDIYKLKKILKNNAISDYIRSTMECYLVSLPGYNNSNHRADKNIISQVALDQHENISMFYNNAVKRIQLEEEKNNKNIDF